MLNNGTGRSSGCRSKRTANRASPAAGEPRSVKPFDSGCTRRSRYAASRHRKIARLGRLTCTASSTAGFTSAVYANGSNGVPSNSSAAGSRTGSVPPRGTEKRVSARRAIGRPAAGVRTLMIEVLRPAQVLAQLDTAAGPAGEIQRQPLDGSERALAASQRDRVRHIGANGARLAFEVRRAEEIADVRDDPVLARVDEQVVIELLDVGVDGAECLFDRRQVRAQLIRRRLLGVADAIDLGEPIEERHARAGHAHSPAEGSSAESNVRCCGASCSNSFAAHGAIGMNAARRRREHEARRDRPRSPAAQAGRRDRNR